MIKINISKDFSKTPGPRYINEGSYSGEEFRKKLLLNKIKEAIEKSIPIEVDLDGTAGYGTSFLEESFGGLIREDKLPYDKLIEVLNIVSEEEDYLSEDIMQYLRDAFENETL